MFTVNESTTRKVDFKNVSLRDDGVLIDKDGNIVCANLLNAFRAAFQDRIFTVSATSKDNEEIPMDEEFYGVEFDQDYEEEFEDSEEE